MRFARPVPAPDLLPLVPGRLAEKLTAYLDRTLWIEISVHVAGRQWEQINILHMEDEPLEVEHRAEDVVLVGGWITACCDGHAHEVGRDGKYRAVLVRYIGEKDRRTATFKVERETEARRREVEARRRTRIQWSKSGNPWEDLAIAGEALARVMAQFNERMMDRVLEQQRIRQTRVQATLAATILSELAALCEEGLHMQADEAREVTEQRMQQWLAQKRAQVDARVWETLAPVFEGAVAWFRRSIEQAHGSEGDAHEVGDEPDAERTEGAPPSSGDAPSPGKVRSGA